MPSARALCFGALFAATFLMPRADCYGHTFDRRPVSVEDIARFATIGDVGGKTSLQSPDGKYEAIIVQRGNVNDASVDADLVLFSRSDLLTDPKPIKIATFQSRSNFRPISALKWSSRSDKLYFIGASGESAPQVYSADTSGVTSQLSRELQAAIWFDVAADDRRVALLTAPSRCCASAYQSVGEGRLIQSLSVWDVPGGETSASPQLVYLDLETGERSVFRKSEEVFSGLRQTRDMLPGGISPDGRYAIRAFTRDAWPTWVADYSVSPRMKLLMDRNNERFGYSLVLINLETGAQHILLDTPWRHFENPEPIWIDGGAAILLVGALEPLANVMEAERAFRAANQFVVAVDTKSGRIRRVATIDTEIGEIESAHWDGASQTLTITGSGRVEAGKRTASYKRTTRQWHRLPVPQQPTRSQGPLVVLQQSSNDPPLLNAIDQSAGKKRLVLDPNPWLKEYDVLTTHTVHWQHPSGATWLGGLIYPRNYRKGVRYPTIILTHGFKEQLFSLHGISRNFAAQALAAEGFVVLQVSETGVGKAPNHAVYAQAGYEAAIRYLDDAGISDPRKIGVVAWSRTGTWVGRLLTHSEIPIAAALFVEAGIDGPWIYLGANSEWIQSDKETEFGALPFGPGFSRWLEASPSLNLQRVRSPVLLWSSHAHESWDWFAGLRRLGMPVEYWVAKDGAHDAFKMKQRIRLGRLTVDWFNFWLKGQERSTASPYNSETAMDIKDQYQRWQSLGKVWAKRLSEPRPPLLRWSTEPVPSSETE